MEEKLIPLTQYSLLVQSNFNISYRNSKRVMETVALIFFVELKQ